ncbi:hypothetical protein ETC01_16330 [Geobacillus sp. NFOSA3]|nr:hypothetical protein [Geobacillus sp. NFOSA3]
MGVMERIQDLPLMSEFYKKEFINNIPYGLGGIYFIYNKKKELLYIGQSNNLRVRLQTHFNGNSHVHNSNEFYYFKYHEVQDIFERDIYETYYIAKFCPKHNLAKNTKEMDPIPFSKSNIEKPDGSLFENVKGLGTLNKLAKKYPDEFRKHMLYKMNQL